MQDILITEMRPEHREGRGRVHYRAWEETYRGLMPDAFLDGRSEAQCIEIAKAARLPNLVALAGDEVVGFVCYSAQVRELLPRPETSEIISLYLLQACQGRGIGRALLSAALARLPYPRVALLVLQGNGKAIGFYQHMGFTLTGRSLTQETGYGPITELEMLYEK